MRKIGSVLFAVWLGVFTPVFSMLAILSSPLPPLWRYRIISRWSRLMVWAAKVFCGIRYRVVGAANLPARPCVLLSRHESAWETIAFQAIFPPHAIVLKKELLRIPFFGWGLARMSPIAIDRADGRRALRAIREEGCARLAAGMFVVVFPEGTRMPPESAADWHPGGAWLAKEAGVPAVPVALNSGKCWPKNSFFKRAGLITVQIGTPLPPDLSAKEINARAREWVEKTRAA